MSLRGLLPRAVRRHRILGGPLRGMRINASWFNYPRAILGVAEKRLVQWFADNVQPGETWIDVGAHGGFAAQALSRPGEGRDHGGVVAAVLRRCK